MLVTKFKSERGKLKGINEVTAACSKYACKRRLGTTIEPE
jgi:hypothetical protein